MTAVASLTHIRVMVGRPQTAHTAAKITTVKDLALIFRSVCFTLHKIVFRVPKITRTARTLCEIKGVM